MTKLLVVLEDQDDARVAYSVRADIVLVSGTLQKMQKLCSALKNMAGYSPQIWLRTSDPHLLTSRVMERCGAQRIVVSALPEELPAFVKTLANQCNDYPLVALIEAENSPDNSLITIIGALGFTGILLQPRNLDQTILSQIKVGNIGQFMTKSRANNLEAGVIGMIEAPDIPRLLPYSPDWLGFIIKHPVKSGQFGDNATNLLMRALLPVDSGQEQLPEGSGLGTDRIIIEDFILPMEIGAYKREYGHKQKVRFNIKADVERLSSNPEDMRHIFSYDLILDGIKNLVSLGHVELVETLAERIAALILAYPRVQRVIVRVDKLELGPAAVGVEIERQKKKA